MKIQKSYLRDGTFMLELTIREMNLLQMACALYADTAYVPESPDEVDEETTKDENAIGALADQLDKAITKYRPKANNTKRRLA